MFIILMIWNGWFMSSEKQLILIILAAVIMFGYQWIKDEKKKHDYRKKYRKSQGWE